MTELQITCRPGGDTGGWTCDVTIAVEGGATTRHAITVAAADLERLDPGARDPHDLVDRSCRFLLQREPNTSILRAFDLMEIGRYFAEFEASMRGR
jgi:hypothetical protein